LTITNATRWIDSVIAEAKDGLALERDRLRMVIATIVLNIVAVSLLAFA